MFEDPLGLQYYSWNNCFTTKCFHKLLNLLIACRLLVVNGACLLSPTQLPQNHPVQRPQDIPVQERKT